MGLQLVTPPQQDVLSAADLAAHLRISNAAEDALLEIYARAARQHVDGRAGILGRALVTQTWDWTLDALPCDPCAVLHAPLPPLQDVTSIKYIDDAGVEQTWPSAKYIVDRASGIGRIGCAYGESWPVARRQINAATVRLVVGYGDDPDDVPEPIGQALRLLAGHWYENREAVNVGNLVTELPFAVKALLAPYRVYGGAT
jgi:uncharacterized phiE125 gp8 family phage protein